MAQDHITVSESIATYLRSKGSRAPEYRRDVKISLTAFQRAAGDLQMRHLREEHFTDAFETWAKQIAPGTLNKRLGHLQQWLNYSARRHQMRTSPAELLGSVERRKVIPRKRVYLSAVELLGILDVTNHPRDRMYLALAMNTALRASEIVSLKLEDVDLDNGWLSVLRHKTATRDILPITTDLDRELRRWLRFYTEKVGVLSPQFLLVPAKGLPPLRGGGKRLTVAEHESVPLLPERQMSRNHGLMQRMLSASGYPVEREGLHTIRRSVARVSYEYFIEQGEARDEALSTVQATLGHSTQSITEKYIGVERFKEKRDRAMRGQPFLSAMVGDQSNVRRLHG